MADVLRGYQDQTGDENMDVVEKSQLDASSAASHWYYEAKFRLLQKHLLSLPLVPSDFTCADVGSGLGIFLHKLETAGLASQSRSIGVDPAYSTPHKAYQSGITIYPAFPPDSLYDVLMLMDVLEHVGDDAALLEHAAAHTTRPGYVFITVPALPALWSSHDIFLGHYRRYTLQSLERLIRKNNRLEILKLHYFFAGILPAAIPVRLMKAGRTTPVNSDMAPVPEPWNRWLAEYCKLELAVATHNRIAGLTAVALCKIK